MPGYRSERSLPELMERIETALKNQEGGFEVICVDDRSPDGTWKVLQQLREGHPFLRCVRLRRNAGQHNAILCGFSFARGRVVITMDDDLQNPPEEIPALVAAVDGGFDLAIGAYERKAGGVKSAGGGIVDSTQRMIFDLPSDFQLTSFRAVRGDIVRSVVESPSTYPYVTSMLLSAAGSYTNVPVEHHDRKHGSSNYNLRKSFRLAGNLLLNYSTIPIGIAAVGGAVVLSGAAGLSGWVLLSSLAQGVSVPGWASIILVTTVLTSVNLGALLILMIYVARIYAQMAQMRVPYSIEAIDE